ncbi:metallophosphoesterase family protein [Thalassoglobus sp. JC818]|uniref:metallophosphoesterase family protein n=1 Tax=Thalassoglobus sp. JC818 TaxID=3232136 RepID=UPI0034575E9C
MRILVLADIHSNWAALRAIDEEFDHCVFVGDLVDYGTNPLPCIDWVRRNVDAHVRGNHDHAVAQRVQATSGQGFRQLAAATRPLHWDLLDSRRMKFLGRMPVTTHFRVEDTLLYLVHATPRDPMDEYLGPDEAAWSARLAGIESDFVCVGHSHVPFCLQLDGKTVLNPGSVGQPRDGDPRASYAIIEDGKPSLHRVEYDIDEAVAQLRESGVEDWVVEMSSSVWTSGGRLTREQLERYRSPR